MINVLIGLCILNSLLLTVYLIMKIKYAPKPITVRATSLKMDVKATSFNVTEIKK